jgi:hypothetical protein
MIFKQSIKAPHPICAHKSFGNVFLSVNLKPLDEYYTKTPETEFETAFLPTRIQ